MTRLLRRPPRLGAVASSHRFRRAKNSTKSPISTIVQHLISSKQNTIFKATKGVKNEVRVIKFDHTQLQSWTYAKQNASIAIFNIAFSSFKRAWLVWVFFFSQGNMWETSRHQRWKFLWNFGSKMWERQRTVAAFFTDSRNFPSKLSRNCGCKSKNSSRSFSFFVFFM